MERYEREYKISRIIITLMTFIISIIVFHNEDISFLTVGVALFTAVAFCVSFLGTFVSRKMVATGDRIKNVFLKILYYISLLFAILLIAYLFLMILYFINDARPSSNEWSDALSRAIILVLTAASFFVMVVVPYIQSLIVLILRRILKKNQE